MHPIKVFILVMLALIGSHYKNYVSHKETGEKIMARLYDLELRILPESLENGVPIYSERGYAKIRGIHDCQQIIYEEFELWK